MFWATPLNWPANWARTPAEKRSNGRGTYSRSPGRGMPSAPLSIAHALELLDGSTAVFGCDRAEVSLDVRWRDTAEGVVFMAEPAEGPSEPGIVLAMERGGDRVVLPVDLHLHAADNLRAAGRCVEALAALEKHGGIGLAARVFAGLSGRPPWWAVLGVGEHAPPAEVEAAFRAAVKDTRRDRSALLRARDEARRLR